MKKNDTFNYIKNIAQAKSISVAADQLGISQPALSAHLKKTEKELGMLLFDRSRQPLEPTEAGRVYLEYIDEVLAAEKELMQKLSDIDDLKTGSLTVGGASFFNVSYLPAAIAAFASENPGIEMEIVDGTVPELVTMAQKGFIDLFMTPEPGEPDRFIYEELLEEEIYLAVPAGWDVNRELEEKAVSVLSAEGKFEGSAGTVSGKPSPLTKGEFTRLCDSTFVLLKPDQNIGRRMQALLEKYDCRPARIITAEQTMTTLALTQKGVGISMITESSIKNSRLVSLPKLYMVDPEICNRKMYVAYPKNKYLSKAATGFIRILKESNR